MLQYFVWLASLPGLGSRKKQQLLAAFGTPELLFYASRVELAALDCLRRDQIDLMLELITHLSSAQFAASYMQKDVVKEGILIQDPSGSFTLGGTPLPPMTDIEVYVHDDELDQDVWKRVFIGGSPKQRICGLKHPNLTSGIHARIRG